MHLSIWHIFISDRRLVIICSSENEDRAHIIAAFDEYRVHATPSCATSDILRSYLTEQLTCSRSRNSHYKDEEIEWQPASYLDTEKYDAIDVYVKKCSNLSMKDQSSL